MTQQAIEANVKELIALVESGKTLDAFDKFYHEDLVMQENHGEERIGKAVNRKFEEDFLAGIQNVRDYRSTGYMAGSGVASIRWKVDMDHAAWGSVDFTEITLQEWRDGQIVRESFHYQF